MDSRVTANPLNSAHLSSADFDFMLANSSKMLNISTVLTLWEEVDIAGFYGSASAVGSSIYNSVMLKNNLSRFAMIYSGGHSLR